MKSPINGSPILLAKQMPTQGMKMLVTTKNGMLTLEFEKQVSYLQFNRTDAQRFVNGLSAYIKTME
jgi:hypothetical protein